MPTPWGLTRDVLQADGKRRLNPQVCTRAPEPAMAETVRVDALAKGRASEF